MCLNRHINPAMTHTVQKRHFGFLKCLFLWVVWILIVFPSFSARVHAACLLPEARLAQVKEWVGVKKIVDGDTIHLKDGRKVRFIGVNTPEIGRRGEVSEPFSQQAYQFLKQLLSKQKTVGLSFDQEKKDRYGRILSHVTLKDGQSVEQLLLTQGLAHSILVPPNLQQADCFRQVEATASKLKLGVWQLPEMQSINAVDLSSKSQGYRFVLGTVSDYSESRKSVYLKLTSRLTVRIANKDLKHFLSLKLKTLVGKKIQARGWVNSYKGRQSIHVRSAYDIQAMN
jgi:micrococcal nuclease